MRTCLWTNPRVAAVVVLGVAAVLLAFAYLLRLQRAPATTIPDFAAIADTGARKQAFVDFLLPFVIAANEAIAAEREELETLRDSYLENGDLDTDEERRFRALAEAYGIDSGEAVNRSAFKALLRRIDQIPPSMALAQAALESGWGKSRFAREGNNFFGTRCFEPGCGMVPRRRARGATFEVAAYRSPEASFAYYIRNLNTNASHSPLRVIRQAHRERGLALDGHAIAAGLVRYSQEGTRYVSKVQRLIRSEDLVRFDRSLLRSDEG